MIADWWNSLNIQSSIENHQLIVNGFKLVKTIFAIKSTKLIIKKLIEFLLN